MREKIKKESEENQKRIQKINDLYNYLLRFI
jgi:hypothetical protein